MKKLLSIILSVAMVLAISLTAFAADTTIINPTESGDSNITMNGATIPSPTYTVTIPEKIEFGNVSKKLKSASDDVAITKTAEYTVTADYEYLFENQKNLTVSISTDNQIKNGDNAIAFNLYKDDNSSLTSGNTIFAIQPTAVEKNTVSQKMYATLDQREIKASGNYTGTVTFTVALADNK